MITPNAATVASTRVAGLAQEAFAGFPHHHSRQQEKEGGLGECRDAFHLAVAVMMFVVGRPVGDADGEIGHHRRGDVDQRMRRLGQNGE